MKRRLLRGDGGSVAVELVLVAPVLLVALLLVVGLGRMAMSRQLVEGAAADAARAASLERNTDLSTAAGKPAAERSLADRGLSCASVTVAVDVSGYEPGGSVTASVTCTADLADVALSGLPGSRTFSATAVVPVETYWARSSGFTDSEGPAAASPGQIDDAEPNVLLRFANPR